MTETQITPTRPELVEYEKSLSRMLPKHEGQYVVITGSQIWQYFDQYEAALEWAYEKFGLDAFFVKRVSANELNTVHYTRDLGPCRS